MCIGVVCDGIGGMKSGEYASTKMVEQFQQWWDSLKSSDLSEYDFDRLTNDFKDQIHKANDQICRDSAINSIQTGSTLSGVIIVNNRFMTFNIGDSRVYLVNKSMIQLTSDDVTFVERRGNIKSVLNQCIGHDQNIFINTTIGSVNNKDSFLFCSDGFYKLMKRNELIKKLYWSKRNNNMTKLCCSLINTIKQRGEKDNISVGIIKCFDK